MRHMLSIRSILTLLGAAALSACGEDAVQQIAAPLTGASVKFFNFAIATPPTTSAPAVNFYANDTKLTAISSTTGSESTSGTTTGNVANGGFYSQLTAGEYTLTGRITATTDNGVAIATLPASLADGKFYSYYMSGYYNTTTKKADAFLVEDAFPAEFDFTVAYVRFVNAAVSGTTGGAAAQTLYALNQATNAEMAIGSAVAYKAGGAFVAVPSGIYNLSTRTTGSAANVVTRNDVPFSAGRVYTVTVFGDVTVTSTTATNRVRLDNTLNR
jgi:hypothetical protein